MLWIIQPLLATSMTLAYLVESAPAVHRPFLADSSNPLSRRQEAFGAEDFDFAAQLKPVAIVGLPFEWQAPVPPSLRRAEHSTLGYYASDLLDWMRLDPYSGTFSGEPTENDSGEFEVTLVTSAGPQNLSQTHKFVVEPTSSHLLKVNDPFTAQIVAKEPGTSDPTAVIASAYAYSSNSTLHPGIRVPPAWSFSLGLLHPFIHQTEQDIGNPIYYAAHLVDGSPLPDWLIFDNTTITFDGIAPYIGDRQGNQLYQVQVSGSHRYGYVDASQTFNLTISSHSLEADTVDAKSFTSHVNVTCGYETLTPWDAVDGFRLDGQRLDVSNISHVHIKSTETPWVSWLNSTKEFATNPPTSLAGKHVEIPIQIKDVFGDSLDSLLNLSLEPYVFTGNVTDPNVLMAQLDSTDTSFPASVRMKVDLERFLTTDVLTWSDFEFSAVTDPGENTNWLDLVHTDGHLYLSGTPPNNTSEFGVKVKAENKVSSTTSLLSFRVDLQDYLSALARSQTAPLQPGGLTVPQKWAIAIGTMGLICGLCLVAVIYLKCSKSRYRTPLPRDAKDPALFMGMRNFVLYCPEGGFFSDSKRSAPRGAQVESYQDSPGSARYSFETVVVNEEKLVADDFKKHKSEESFHRVFSRSFTNFCHLLKHVTKEFRDGIRSKKAIDKESISRPISPTSTVHGLTLTKSTTPESSSSFSTCISDTDLQGKSLIQTVRQIGSQTPESCSTVFTNFSGDSQLWGGDDPEAESNFSRTPSHRHTYRMSNQAKHDCAIKSPSDSTSSPRQRSAADYRSNKACQRAGDICLSTVFEYSSPEGRNIDPRFKDDSPVSHDGKGARSQPKLTAHTSSANVDFAHQVGTPFELPGYLVGCDRSATNESSSSGSGMPWTGDKGSILNQGSSGQLQYMSTSVESLEYQSNRAQRGEPLEKVATSMAVFKQHASGRVANGQHPVPKHNRVTSRRTGSRSYTPQLTAMYE